MIELPLSCDDVAECCEAVNVFAELLIIQSNYSGDVKCLDIAIVLLKYFLPLDLVTRGHPNNCDILNELGATLLKCFKTTRDINDIDEAISSYENALEITPKSQSQLFIALNGLGAATILKFGVLNETRLLDIGIEWHRKAAAVRTEPCISRALALHGLGWALVNRYEITNQRSYLDDSILYQREALDILSTRNPVRIASLNNISITYRLLFERTGEMVFLQQSINSLKEATSLLPAHHPHLSVLLHNLGTSLKEVFPHSGRPEDLEAAIETLIHARDLRPEPHPLRHTTLDSLALAYQLKFEQSGLLEHLDDAVALHRDARKLYIEYNGKDEYGNLHNLANAVYTRFRRSDRQEDLLESMSLYQATLSSMLKSHYSRPASLNNLAYALKSHFQRTGNIENLNESIALLQEALQLTEKIAVNKDGPSQKKHHPARVLALNNLGNVILMHYEIERSTDEIDKAVEWHRAAVTLTRELWHNERAMFLNDLACALCTRYSYSFYEKDIREAFTLHHESLSLIGQNHPETSKISSDLAKSLFLHYSHTQISASLDSAVTYFHVSVSCESSPMSIRFIAAREWAQSADSALHLSSLEAYEAAIELLPLLATLGLDVKFRQEVLKSGTDGLAANNSSVVILNASIAGCDALIITNKGVAHIPLNKFDMEKGDMLVRLVQVSSNSMRSRNDGISSSAIGLSTDDSVNRIIYNLRKGRLVRSSTVEVNEIHRYVLAALWDDVVQPVIQHLQIQKSASTPVRLYWCPTGLFTFLPIHAAGYYIKNSEDYASQYIVSSYTPTLFALLIPRRRSESKPTSTLEIMTVIQPKTLPFTEVELNIIESRVPRKCLITLSTQNFPASVEKPTRWRVACAGRWGAQDIQIMQHEMPNASLAFLCACETAMGTDMLPDEGIHLGSTLLFAGFKSVVATMWNISDEDGPKVADHFYQKSLNTLQELYTMPLVNFDLKALTSVDGFLLLT
ncbi:hypothetical protein BDQ12DRAFT_726418 [Crucibulum laeve]|uniref:CHAT domain-containing protein n=1 Tax=Crucibulum laeve TaxID=68775 RepID=A0A5C3LQ64_9AGAR|nr:hypothetical protein BDQ12DRAFT_726418 [Crucibulum laeve]